MKKNKKAISILLITIILIIVIALGIILIKKKDNANEIIDKNMTNAYKAIINIEDSNEYYLKYKYSEGEYNSITKVAKKNGDIYVEIEENGELSKKIIFVNEQTYEYSNEQDYTVKPGKSIAIEPYAKIFSNDIVRGVYTENYETGEEEINGEKCQYEKFNIEDGTQTYYFYEDQLKLIKYNVGDYEMNIEILEFSTMVDISLFRIK